MSTATKTADGFIDIQIGHNIFRFRSLTWMEETDLDTSDMARDRAYFAKALISVSGIAFSPEDSKTIIKSIPLAIFKRAFLIYKALESEGQDSFKTTKVYFAPNVKKLMDKVKLEDDSFEKELDLLMKQDAIEMEETEMAIHKNSNLKGAVKLS